RDRAAICVVGWVDDELVIEGHSPSEQREAVIGLDDLFMAGVRQNAVADQDAKTTSIEEGLVHPRNPVDDSGKSEGVVRLSPSLASKGKSSRNAVVDIGVIIGLDIAIGHAGAGEDAEIIRHLLLKVRSQSAAAGVAADHRDVGGAARHLRK